MGLHPCILSVPFSIIFSLLFMNIIMSQKDMTGKSVEGSSKKMLDWS